MLLPSEKVGGGTGVTIIFNLYNTAKQVTAGYVGVDGNTYSEVLNPTTRDVSYAVINCKKGTPVTLSVSSSATFQIYYNQSAQRSKYGTSVKINIPANVTGLWLYIFTPDSGSFVDIHTNYNITFAS